MTFRNHTQRARVAIALLSMVRLRGLFTLNGPTQDAEFYLRRGERQGLTKPQVIMLRLAWDVWSSDGHAEFGRVFGSHLTPELELAIAELIHLGVTIGDDGIEAWLEQYSPKEKEQEALSA